MKKFSLILMVLACTCLSACNKTKLDNETKVPELSAEAKANKLFDEAMELLDENRYEKAIEKFEEIERTYPYAKVATSAPLMAALAYYKDSEYDDAIINLDRFISLHPGNERIPYAYYLKAMSYYERMTDVKRDQEITAKAKSSLEELIRRFPQSNYAKDAKLKLDLVIDHLAGKEMEIGRFYLKKRKYIAAINRFKVVLNKYDQTSHAKEALYRLTESYVSLGIKSEARKYAAILGHNYPESKWYHRAYKILKK